MPSRSRAAYLAAGALAGAAAWHLVARSGSRAFGALLTPQRRGLAAAATPRACGSFGQQVTFIYVKDLERSARFYGQVLGLRAALEQTPPGEAAPVVRIFEVTPTAFLGVCQRDPASLPSSGVAPDGVIVCLVSDQVDLWAEHLRAAGIGLEKEPTLNPRYDIYHLFVRDPDGHLVEIQQFRDPSWPRPPGAPSGGLLEVVKGRATGSESWPVWSCPALPDPAGRFQESRWWESRPGVAEERCLILEGRATLTTPDGNKVVIEAGDWVTFRKGFTCLWEVEETISKRYAYFAADGSEWSLPAGR